MNRTVRKIYLIGFLSCFFSILAALFMQYGMQMEPCPLCLLSRVTIIFIGILFLIATAHNPISRAALWIYAMCGTAMSCIGIGLSARHLWLISLPEDQVPACGPSIDYLMQVLPLQEVMKLILTGSGECAQHQELFLGLNLPTWTLGLFLLLAGLWISSLCQKKG